ncbi:MucBP domain-containing protein [Enterococcus faecalis]|uniref:MucBP domain-containing protein n=1 Tax=Enterococcus faecalis TaxID=1351 RepID=UPI00076FB1FA|nr:MucBP domain-containing protein [Enterococcus faecalis]
MISKKLLLIREEGIKTMKKYILSTLLFSTLLIGTTNVNAEAKNDRNIDLNKAEATSNLSTNPLNNKEEIIYSSWGNAPVEFNKSSGQLIVKKGEISNYTYITDYVDESNEISKKDVKSIIFEDVVQVPSYGRHLFSAINMWTNLESITGNLDTSKVTDMSDMFCNPALSNIELSNFDTSNATNMQFMFQSSKVSQLNLQNFDTSKVTNMASMFQGMPNLTNLDVSNFDTSNVTTMQFMFDTIPNLKSLTLSNFDTSKVEDMSYMFRRDYSINELDLTSFNTSNVRNMEDMFSSMSNLKKLDLSSFGTSNITMYGIFYGDYKLSCLTLGNAFKFGSASELPEIDQTNGLYSGKWIKSNPVTPNSIYDSSKVFMEKYDGSLPGTYVWQEEQPESNALVTVNYEDEEGNEIADSVILNGNVGEEYTTDQKEIAGYTFKEVKGNATGQFTDQAQIVTYVYTKNSVAGGDVTVKYVDEDGNSISEDVVKTGNIDDQYTTDQKEIAGYTFKEVKGNATGQFTDQAQIVTYVYTKNSIAGGDVTVKYVDEDGNSISEDVIKTGNIDDQYTTDQKEIAGYTFKEVQGNATGQFTDQAQTVTYIYTKDPTVGGNLTVKYTDEDGNTISEDVIKSGNIGEEYTTDQKEITGYTFKEVQGNVTGQFTDQPQTIIYVYTKDQVKGSKGHSNTGNQNTGNTNSNKSSSKTLPKTGEKQTAILSILGSLISGSAGIIALVLKRKK